MKNLKEIGINYEKWDRELSIAFQNQARLVQEAKEIHPHYHERIVLDEATLNGIFCADFLWSFN